MEYGRLGEFYSKKHSQTPPKSSYFSTTAPAQPINFDQKEYELKTSSIKRGNTDTNSKRDFMQMKIKDSLNFGKCNDFASMKTTNYDSVNKTESKFGFKPPINDFYKPEYTSTKNYQRMMEHQHHSQLRKYSQDSLMKSSLLHGSQKHSLVSTSSLSSKNNACKGSRDSLNSVSSGSNNSNNARSSPIHLKTDSNVSTVTSYQNSKFIHARSPSMMYTKNYLQKTKLQNPNLMKQIKSTSLPSSSILHAAAIASASSPKPPKPIDLKNQKRGSSLTRGENKYRIQF
jgi:hypothetical protein